MKKRSQKLLALFMAAAISFTAVSPQTVLAAGGTVKSVTIVKPSSKSAITVYRGKKDKTAQLKVKVKTTGKVSKGLKFTSSQPKVVSVSSTGKLRALKAGKATIKVTSIADKKKSDSIKITVKQNVTSLDSEVKDLKKSDSSFFVKKKNSFYLKKGQKYRLKNVILPTNASNKSVSYSSNSKKVTVDKKGVITAKSTGTALIKVKANDKSGETKLLRVTVTKNGLSTTVSPKPSATATLNVKVSNTSHMDADAATLLSFTAVAPGKTKAVNINGTNYTASYDGVAVTFDGKKLSEIVGAKKDATIVFTGNLKKLVDGVCLAKPSNYTLKVGSLTITGKAPVLKINGKEYKVSNKNGVLTFEGDLTKTFKSITSLADVKASF